MPVGLSFWNHLLALIAVIMKSLNVITPLFLMTVKYLLKMGDERAKGGKGESGLR